MVAFALALVDALVVGVVVAVVVVVALVDALGVALVVAVTAIIRNETCVRSKPMNYEKLPPHIRDGAKLYIEEGVSPGGFLYACLADKLVEAFTRADAINATHMFEIAQWLYSDCPAAARGSEAKVNQWILQGGLNGLEKKGLDQ